ncbi:MAG: hypothetical protein U0790_09650 [Isosphaeraceae bacterium]
MDRATTGRAGRLDTVDRDREPSDEDVLRRVVVLCAEIGARAAGCWRVDPERERLIQVAFVPGAGLDPEVARAFAEATREVSIRQEGLGIVVAALSGEPAVSRVEALSPDSGSGRWLRAFGADRSIAVPVLGPDPGTRIVCSVAVSRPSVDDVWIARRIREVMALPAAAPGGAEAGEEPAGP